VAGGRPVFLVLTGAFQFGHGVGGFTANFIHSPLGFGLDGRAFYWHGVGGFVFHPPPSRKFKKGLA
jgi:hypothetical protein